MLVGADHFEEHLGSPLGFHIDRKDVIESDLSLEGCALAMLRDR